MATNREIRQHPLGIPVPGDVLVFQSLVDLKTYRVPVDQFIPSSTTNNIEWTSAAATAGDYDIDVIVTRGGDIYQSTINNNPNVPGSDATWTLLTKGKSGFVLWAAGVFLEDEVFVLREIGNVIHIFRLASVTRPYNSTNFTTELAAGDWELVGRLELIQVDTSGAINLNMLNLVSLAFRGSVTIDGNANVTITNDAFALEIRFFRFTINAGIQLTFEGDVIHSQFDGAWDGPAGIVWTCPADGVYELFATKSDGLWRVRIQ